MKSRSLTVNGTYFVKTINVLVAEFVRIQADFQSSEFSRIQLRSEVSAIALTVAALKTCLPSVKKALALHGTGHSAATL